MACLRPQVSKLFLSSTLCAIKNHINWDIGSNIVEVLVGASDTENVVMYNDFSPIIGKSIFHPQ